MMIGGQATLGAGAPPPSPPLTSPDFIVASDPEWDAVFANDAAALAGKTIEITGANFTQRAITNKDIDAVGGRLIIRSANSSASIPSVILTGTVRGIDFAGVNFQMTGWPKAYGACVTFGNGTFGKLRFLDGTTFRHGYGAALADIDTAVELPEYDRISNIRAATATSTTYPLAWKDPGSGLTGWIEFFNRGASTVYVAVGGSDVVATSGNTACAAGQRIRISSGVTPGSTTHFAILSAGSNTQVNARTEIGLAEYLAPAFGASGAAVIEDIEFRNCLFRDLANGVKGINPDSVIVMDCDFDRIYMDVLSLAPKVGGFAYLLRNIECLPFARSGIAENLNGDARDPHGDQFQMFSNGAGTIGPVYYAGNRIRVSSLRGDVGSQGIFISDNDTVPSYSGLFFISTMQVGGAPNSLFVGEPGWPARDLLVYGASVVDWRDAASTRPSIGLVTDDGGSIYVGSAISYNITSLDQAVTEQGTLRLSAVANPNAVFPDLAGLTTATTRSQIEAAITTAAEGAGLGAVATADAVDWTTPNHENVIRWENVPSGAHWMPLTGQNTDTLITFPPRKILNPRPGQAVDVGIGTEWRKLAADGTTELLGWATNSGTIDPGQFIQIRRASSAIGGETVAASVTINGFDQSAPILTANAPASYLVQGSPVAYFTDPANVPSGTRRMTWRGKFYWPSGTIGNAQKPFSQLSLGCDLETFNDGFRISVEDGTQASMFSAAPIRFAGQYVANAWLDIIFDVDQVAATASLTINGVTEVYPFDKSSNGVFNTVRKIGFVASPGGGNSLPAGVRAADMSLEFNGILRKLIPNDAAIANSDPWKKGFGSFGNAP